MNKVIGFGLYCDNEMVLLFNLEEPVELDKAKVIYPDLTIVCQGKSITIPIEY